MLGLIGLALITTRPTSHAQTAGTFVLYTPEGRRQLPVRVSAGVEVVSLDQLAGFFGLTLTEDAGVGGLTVRGRGQTVLLIPGQSFASIGPGRIVSLPGPIQRERNAWQVPLDFIRLVIGPALNLRVDVRRPSRLIVVGDIRVPRITGRFEKQAGGLRLTIEATPGAPHRVTREGNRLFIRYEATALDTSPIVGAVAEFATAARYEGTAVVVDLGPQTASFKADDVDASRLVVDLLAPAPPPPPPPPPPPTPPPAAAPVAPAAAAGTPAVTGTAKPEAPCGANA